MIIKSAEELRNLTGSYYANSDFTKIEAIVRSVEDDLARIISPRLMAQLAKEAEGQEVAVSVEMSEDETLKVANREFTINGGSMVLTDGYSAFGITARLEDDTLIVSNARAVVALKQAIAYMATMRYYRLNDLTHENQGRKVKMDKENEARPFEWQLARDDRAHLDEYYRALDRLMSALYDDPRYWLTETSRQQARLIVADADTLAGLTGLEPSPWLFHRLVPFLDESQRLVVKAYGGPLPQETEETAELLHAARMATALGALALMGRRTSLQTLPYGLMKQMEQDGGGNRREQPSPERLDEYLKHLGREKHYWLNEMRTLRDRAAAAESGEEVATYLQMPENDRNNKYMRL